VIQYDVLAFPLSDRYISGTSDETQVKILREQYICPHFRILVIGRANAGKTTILEKMCGVAKGTKPIIYDKDGKSG
jgi:GTPase SAR1 family protein